MARLPRELMKMPPEDAFGERPWRLPRRNIRSVATLRRSRPRLRAKHAMTTAN